MFKTIHGQTVTVQGVAYALGDVVFLRVRQDRLPGMVTGIVVRPGGVLYYVTWSGGCEMSHYEIELTREYVPSYE